MDKWCAQCGTVFPAERNTAKFCSDICSKRNQRGIPKDEKLMEAIKKGLPALEDVDRTKAFTEEQYAIIRTLERNLWMAYMARPNSRDLMTQEDIEIHYRNVNYPKVTYTNKR